jgi:protein-disulfide isomerase-like protein with CxxC motif
MMIFLDKETQETFCKKIQNYVEKWDTSYIDAVTSICEDSGIDPENAAKFLTKPIIEKIKEEAKELNYLPKTTKLPF